MKGHQIRDKLQGRVDPALVEVLTQLGEAQSGLRNEIKTIVHQITLISSALSDLCDISEGMGRHLNTLERTAGKHEEDN